MRAASKQKIGPRRDSVPERLGVRGEEIGRRLGWAPALTTAGVLVAGYAFVAAVLVRVGLLLTHVLLLGIARPVGRHRDRLAG